jgi:hypothetical protein
MEKATDPDDLLLKARIGKEIMRVQQLARLSSKLPRLKAAPIITDPVGVIDDVYRANILNNQRLRDFNSGMETISDTANTIIQQFTGNLPSEAILNLVAGNMQDLTELKSIENVLDAAIKNIQSRFLNAKTKGFDVRKVEDLTDLGGTLARLKQVQTELANTAFTLEYQPTLDTINGVVKNQITSDYNKLLQKKIEVSRRIKELE